MQLLKGLNLALTFFLELAMLIALGYWGFTQSGLILGIGAPLLAAVIWGLWMAPKSTRRLTGVRYLLLKFILFGAAAQALVAAGQPVWAVVFAVVALLNQILLIVWDQRLEPL